MKKLYIFIATMTILGSATAMESSNQIQARSTIGFVNGYCSTVLQKDAKYTHSTRIKIMQECIAVQEMAINSYCSNKQKCPVFNHPTNLNSLIPPEPLSSQELFVLEFLSNTKLSMSKR